MQSSRGAGFRSRGLGAWSGCRLGARRCSPGAIEPGIEPCGGIDVTDGAPELLPATIKRCTPPPHAVPDRADPLPADHVTIEAAAGIELHQTWGRFPAVRLGAVETSMHTYPPRTVRRDSHRALSQALVRENRLLTFLPFQTPTIVAVSGPPYTSAQNVSCGTAGSAVAAFCVSSSQAASGEGWVPASGLQVSCHVVVEP